MNLPNIHVLVLMKGGHSCNYGYTFYKVIYKYRTSKSVVYLSHGIAIHEVYIVEEARVVADCVVVMWSVYEDLVLPPERGIRQEPR